VKKYINYSKTFLILSLIVIIGLSICVFCCDKIQMHLWLNGTHTPAGDLFIQYYTYIGEWVPYMIVAALLFYKAGWATFLLTDVALSGLIGQALKYAADTDRPLTYFAKYAPDIQLQLVDGVTMSKWLSFPSGHTTTFFALFLTLTIILCDWYNQRKNAQSSERSLLPTTFYLLPKKSTTCNLLSATCCLLALLGGYSRIYLNQHFAEDILGGMIIGIVTTLALLFVVPKLESTKFWNWNIGQKLKK